jgi:hypothetical protein
MSVWFGGVVIDVIDLDRRAWFWSGLLELPVTPRSHTDPTPPDRLDHPFSAGRRARRAWRTQ